MGGPTGGSDAGKCWACVSEDGFQTGLQTLGGIDLLRGTHLCRTHAAHETTRDRGGQRDVLLPLREVLGVSLCYPTENFLARTCRSDGGLQRTKALHT